MSVSVPLDKGDRVRTVYIYVCFFFLYIYSFVELVRQTFYFWVGFLFFPFTKRIVGMIVPHTPCKLQRWSSALNASGSRNVVIIPILIHEFRHRGCLRAHPRCCPRCLCVDSNRLTPIKKIGFSTIVIWLPGISNFGAFFWRKCPSVACYERGGGLVGWLGLWATFRHACHGKKISVPFDIYVNLLFFLFLWVYLFF